MSLEIQIPKEITKYEAKLIGPLTGRQTVGSIIAAVCAVGVNTLLKPISPDLATVGAVLAAVPGAAYGFIKFYGMPFEKYATGYLKTKVLAPTARKSKIQNQYAVIDKEMMELNSGMSILSEKDAKKKKKKVKYKKSKLAYK